MTQSEVPPQSTPSISVDDVDVRRAVLLAVAGAVMLDVRDDQEWAAGHMPGAVHLPLGSVAGADLSVLAGRQVVAVCRSGNRSGKAAAELSDRGARVLNMAGGMKAWAAAGLPIVTDTGAPGSVK